MQSILEKNKSALEFYLSIKQPIREICDPLTKGFGIPYFGYLKKFKDGSYIYISNHEEWNSYYIKHIKEGGHFFPDVIGETVQGKKNLKISLSPSLPQQDEVLSPLLEKFGIWNWVNFGHKEEDFWECWYFASTKDDQKATDFYVNNLHLLKNFIHYFMVKTEGLFNPSNPDQLATLVKPSTVSTALEKRPFFQREIASTMSYDRLTDDVPFFFNEELRPLSKRQKECFYYLVRGKTAKEIGSILDIGFRGVEEHIKRLKHKLACPTKSDLIEKAFESGFIYFTPSTIKEDL